MAHVAYLVIVLGLPGTVFWRRLTGGSGWLTVDIFLGAICGVALECLLYPLGRWLGMPLLPLVMPLLAVILTAIPGKRPPRGRLLPWWSVAGVAAAVGVLVVWFVRAGSKFVPLSGAGSLRPNSDSPYQLALAAELTHHFPPQVPYVASEPLTYHWMAYNHIASAHWITGAELDVLVARIVPLELMLLLVLGTAATAVVLSGKAVAAPIAALLTVLAGDLAPWPWTISSGGLYADGPLTFSQVISPTQALGSLLLMPLIALTAMMLRKPPRAGSWVVALVLITVLSVAKASILPVYAAGLAAAFLYRLIRFRKLDDIALGLSSAVVVLYGAAFILVMRGESHGMTLRPGATFTAFLKPMLPKTVGIGEAQTVLVMLTAGLVLAWLLPLAGAFLARRQTPDDPMVPFLVAAVIAAVVATALFWQLTLSQIFFVRGCFGFGVLMAAWGLANLERRHLAMAVPAVAIGVLGVLAGRAVLDNAGPKSCASLACVETVFALPPLVTAATVGVGVLLLGLLLLVALRRMPRRAWTTLLVAAAIGTTFSPTVGTINAGASAPYGKFDTIPPGGIDAARYIRGQGGPNDLIATNIHCQLPTKPPCASTSFWIPGYAERRVLVQGWAYTAMANARTDRTAALAGPFWDQHLLAANDIVFTSPTVENLTYLRTRYGVRWLLLDERVNPAPGALDELADLRHQSGTVRIYEIPEIPSPRPNLKLPN